MKVVTMNQKYLHISHLTMKFYYKSLFLISRFCSFVKTKNE
jgi:hypothetical protein